MLPAGEELARGVSKRASDKLPGKKDKARWKELTRQARRTAEKGGASPEAAAAAGVEAKAATVRRFMQTIVDVNFAAAGLAEAPAAPAPTEPEPAPAPTPAPAPQQKVLRLKGSVQAEEAVEAACGCEFAQTWLRPGIDKPLGFKPGWEAYDTWRLATHQEHRIERYLAAMKAIKESFPMMVCCDQFDVGGCMHGIPCECGRTQAPWPWIIHHPWASEFCDCHLAMREEWLRWGAGPTSSAELIENCDARRKEWRPECQKAGYSGAGCQCNVCPSCSEGSESDESP